jgi:sterol desaturase/sphingolipid hydroxylase (fatty acid hydroxylase superfamily)
MATLKGLAWWLGFFSLCALFAATGSSQLQKLADTHHGVAAYLLLVFLFAIPTSVATLLSGYLLELLFIGWSRSSLAMLWNARASVKLDVLSIAMAMIPHKRLDYVLSFGLLYAIDRRGGHTASLTLAQFIPTWGVQVGCLLLLQSFVSYWMHRLEHTIPALWALHQFHHSADRMSMLSAERRSLLLRAVEATLLFVPFALLGTATAARPAAAGPAVLLIAAYFAHNTFLRINGYLCHSNLTTDYGWIGRWLIVSPRMHRLHHASAPEYHDKNFTFDFVIWDRLFGTYASCAAEQLPDIPLGLEANPFNNDNSVEGVLREYFLTTCLVFWQELRRGVRAWLPLQTGNARIPQTDHLFRQIELPGPAVASVSIAPGSQRL